MRKAPRSTSTGSSRSASAPRPLPEGTHVTALIAAAGSGERLGAGGPKALVPAAGRPLLAWSVEAFAAAPGVHAAVIVAPPGHETDVEAVAAEAAPGDLAITVVPGGETRGQSVAAGLATVAGEVVAVHDAARPLVTPDLIAKLLEVLARSPDVAGVIAARRIADTVKRLREGGREIERTEDREGLWAAETPQVFRTQALRRAHTAAGGHLASATDDAMLVEADGHAVVVEPSPHANLKVTTKADLSLAEFLLAQR